MPPLNQGGGGQRGRRAEAVDCMWESPEAKESMACLGHYKLLGRCAAERSRGGMVRMKAGEGG